MGQSTTAESPGLMRASPTGNEPLLWTRDGLPLVLSDAPDAIYAATNIGNEEEIVAYEKETGARRAILVATWVGSMTTNTSDIFYAHDFVAPGGNELRREWTRVSKQGGPAEVLRETSGLGAVTGDVIAADDERVYVAERDATFSRTTLVEMRTDGSSATPLWEAPSQIWALAIDDTSIYWVADDPNAVTRSILKLAKPAR